MDSAGTDYHLRTLTWKTPVVVQIRRHPHQWYQYFLFFVTQMSRNIRWSTRWPQTMTRMIVPNRSHISPTSTPCGENIHRTALQKADSKVQQMSPTYPQWIVLEIPPSNWIKSAQWATSFPLKRTRQQHNNMTKVKFWINNLWVPHNMGPTSTLP